MATVEIGIKKYNSFYLCSAVHPGEMKCVHMLHIKLIHRECRHHKFFHSFTSGHFWNDEKLCLAFHLKSLRDASIVLSATHFDWLFLSLTHSLLFESTYMHFYRHCCCCHRSFIAWNQILFNDDGAHWSSLQCTMIKRNKWNEKEKMLLHLQEMKKKNQKYLSRTAKATKKKRQQAFNLKTLKY